jgi:hypothetical protein
MREIARDLRALHECYLETTTPRPAPAQPRRFDVEPSVLTGRILSGFLAP